MSNDLPTEWSRKKIIELGNHDPNTVQTGPFGAQLHSADYVDDGIPFILIKNMQDNGISTTDMPRISEEDAERLSLYRLQIGDIVFSRVGRVGSCFLVREEQAGWVISGQLLRIRLPDSAIEPSYLIYALKSKPAQDYIVNTSVGSTRQSINTNILENLQVIIPTPKEQENIAAVLGAVDDAIRYAEELIAKLMQMRAGLLHDLLTFGLDENGELRDPVRYPKQFKASELGLIPKEWEVVRLLEHVSLPNGQVDPKQAPYCTWPLIAPDHIEQKTGRLLVIETAQDQNAISGKYMFEQGDVLYSKIRPYLRKAVLADREGLCSADMYPLRPGPDINSRFLLAVILGEHFSRFAESVSMRSGFPKINRDELNEYFTALPTPCEQSRIAEILISFDSRTSNEEKTLAKLRLLKQGLMDDLLTGQVQVTELMEENADEAH